MLVYYYKVCSIFCWFFFFDREKERDKQTERERRRVREREGGRFFFDLVTNEFLTKSMGLKTIDLRLCVQNQRYLHRKQKFMKKYLYNIIDVEI